MELIVLGVFVLIGFISTYVLAYKLYYANAELRRLQSRIELYDTVNSRLRVQVQDRVIK